MSYKRYKGQDWFYSLKTDKVKKTKSLIDNYSQEIIDQKFPVCWITQDYFLFGLFSSYLDFNEYQLKIPESSRTFFETIFGHRYQKPHFDLDITNEDLEDLSNFDNINSETIKDILIESIIDVLKSYNIILDITKHILVYTSHSDKKKSYHIIIDSYCHSGNKEAKAFYDLVIKNLNINFSMIPKKIIDANVYSSTQQFRILGNQKPKSDRPKKFNNNWYYKNQLITYQYNEIPYNEKHKNILELEASLLTYTFNCKLLPSFLPEQNLSISGVNFYNSNFDDTKDIEESIAYTAIDLLAEKSGLTRKDSKFPFVLSKIQGSMILLCRKRASYCSICSRKHDSENAYLIIIGQYKKIYFICRRSNDKKMFIGALNTDIDKDDNPEDRDEDDDNPSNDIIVQSYLQKNNPLTNNPLKKILDMVKTNVDVKPIIYKKEIPLSIQNEYGSQLLTNYIINNEKYEDIDE